MSAPVHDPGADIASSSPPHPSLPRAGRRNAEAAERNAEITEGGTALALWRLGDSAMCSAADLCRRPPPWEVGALRSDRAPRLLVEPSPVTVQPTHHEVTRRRDTPGRADGVQVRPGRSGSERLPPRAEVGGTTQAGRSVPPRRLDACCVPCQLHGPKPSGSLRSLPARHSGASILVSPWIQQ